ncbi:hypothetical protein VTL71DRAFT_11781 [Oculimacula yallundae]|uniref:Transcription factor domain-containing protein n=1 Tax=Oculimacula yallundae TaxID=86028 RepID=A0ABR4CR14_9HELO
MSTTSAARWGTACASCASAKCRCIRSAESYGKCDRRTALLEKKLESLVDLLNSTSGNTSNVQSLLTNQLPLKRNLSDRGKVLEVENDTSSRSQTGENEITHDYPSKFSSIAPPTCICRAPASEEDSQPADTDEVLLSIYTNQLCSWFPFVILPRGTTSSHLQATRPFLLKAIRLVASLRNIRSMWGQRRAIMQYLSEAVFVRSERSLDLLQGILVLLGFYHYHCLVHIQFNNLMQLAVSIVGDMDLNRDPAHQSRVRALGANYEEPRARSNDERRAIVGVWYMSSNVALTFNKGQSEKYTKYHEQCLKELEATNEYESDILLVQLVRVQHLTQGIVDCNNRNQLPDELPGIAETPTSVYHAAFQAELLRLQTSLHPSLQNNHIILTTLNTAHLYLHSTLLLSTTLLESATRTLTTLTLSSPPTLSHFSTCHSALKTWFSHWLTIPVCYYFYMSQPLAAQLIYSMKMLSRWALLFTDHDEILGQINILEILSSMATRFEAAKEEMSAAQGGLWKNGIWDLAARKCRLKGLRIEKWWRDVEGAGGEGMYRFRDGDCEDMNVNASEEAGRDAEPGEVRLGGDDGTGMSRWVEEPFNFGAVGGDEWLWAGDLFDGVDVNQGSFLFDIPPEISNTQL